MCSNIFCNLIYSCDLIIRNFRKTIIIKKKIYIYIYIYIYVVFINILNDYVIDFSNFAMCFMLIYPSRVTPIYHRRTKAKIGVQSKCIYVIYILKH